MPSNRLPRVAGLSYCALILRRSHNQKRMAIEFPRALYLAEPELSLCSFPFVSVHSRMSVQPSGNPCKRSHSVGVNLRTVHIASFAASRSMYSAIVCNFSYILFRLHIFRTILLRHIFRTLNPPCLFRNCNESRHTVP